MLTRGSPTPLYRQFKDRLLKELELGTRGPHSQLPSEREWVEKLGVSRITVRQALSELVQQGYLYTVPGKGFFVGDRKNARELNAFLSFTAAARSRGETPASKLLDGRTVRATAAMANTLQISVGAEVVHIERLRLANGLPMMIQKVELPHARCPGILKKDLASASLFAVLREDFGVALVRAETTITAREATSAEKRLLGLRPPAVVLVVDQITYASDGQPVEHAISVLHPERHPLSLVQEEQGRSLGVV